MTQKNSLGNQQWKIDRGALTPEEIILWLDGYRELMFEIWRQNPHLRVQWEELNLTKAKGADAP